jgi:hypothetical protein
MTVVEIDSHIPTRTRPWPANRSEADKYRPRPADPLAPEDLGDRPAMPLVSASPQFPRVFPGL